MIDCFGPGVGHLNHLAVPGVGIFEFSFVPVTTNHLPGWEISVIFDFTFLPGGREFDSIFLEMPISLYQLGILKTTSLRLGCMHNYYNPR